MIGEWQIVGIVVVSLISMATIAWNVGVWSFKRKMISNGKLSQFVTITMCGEKMEREQINKDEMEKHAEALREMQYEFKEFQKDVVSMKNRIGKIEERLNEISLALVEMRTILNLIYNNYEDLKK